MSALELIIDSIKSSFSAMANFKIYGELSVLSFSVILLVLHTLFDIFWFGAKGAMAEDRSTLLNRYKFNMNPDRTIRVNPSGKGGAKK